MFCPGSSSRAAAGKTRPYCKELIDAVGKTGGYIMAFGAAMDEGKAETMHPMINFIREYGVCRPRVLLHLSLFHMFG